MIEIVILTVLLVVLLLALEPAHRRARSSGPLARTTDPDRVRLLADVRAAAQRLP